MKSTTGVVEVCEYRDLDCAFTYGREEDAQDSLQQDEDGRDKRED